MGGRLIFFPMQKQNQASATKSQDGKTRLNKAESAESELAKAKNEQLDWLLVVKKKRVECYTMQPEC